jgi:glutamyl-tRNA reductase
VLGEGQILAQVKHTHKQGQQHNGIGRILNRLFTQAIAAGKRVRTETSIGTGAVSISSAAVELAQIKVESLPNRRIAILGAGKMARLLVQHLLSKGANHITILNRSMSGAEDLAKQFPESPLQLHTMADMGAVLASSDIVFTSTAATEPLVNRALLENVLAPSQRLMLFDISVPRNVDADVNDLTSVHVFNVDDLKAVVAQNQESRRQMAREAEVLLDEEVAAFDVWWRSLETVTTISCLRDKVETIRTQELEKALSRLGSEFGEKHQEVIEVQLRAQQDIEARRRAMETLCVLFNLDTQAQQGQQYS